jgi:hypothetical protein
MNRLILALTAFIGDLQSRLANPVQLTTDGQKAYLDAVEDTFGTRCLAPRGS